MLDSYDLDVSVTHAEDTSLDAFREAAVAGLNDRDHFVLVNYLRSAMGQEKGGHISPLAAYDADTDRLLVLDSVAKSIRRSGSTRKRSTAR